MSREGTFILKRTPTLVTLVRPVIPMVFLVLQQTDRTYKSLPALVAGIRTLPRVFAHVDLKLGSRDVFLVALVAAVQALARVDAPVHLEPGTFAEGLPTFFALVSLPQVHLFMLAQVSVGLKHLPTQVAGKGRLGGVLDSVAL